jgi:opacity protein-like surface antigen
MRLGGIIGGAALLLAIAASPARADGFVAPFIGGTFSSSAGAVSNSRAIYGLDVGGMGGGAVGFELDFGWAPDFFGPSSTVGDNNITTLMGNLIVGVPIGGTRGAGVRPFVSGGAGLMRQRVDGVTGFVEHVTNNDFGFDLGGGVMVYFTDHVGVRGDLRYFRDFQDHQPGPGLDLGLGTLHFWRGTVGASFRF